MRRVALLGLTMVAACATPNPTSRTIMGQWGGQHVGLVMTEASGRLTYDCAAGTINGPLIVDAAGRFAATGTHTPGQGGPERIGYTPPSYPARYSGSVRGETMTLVADVSELQLRIGPYTLRQGAEPTLLRCL